MSSANRDNFTSLPIVRERQLAYDLTYTWNLNRTKAKQKTQLIEKEIRLVVTKGEGWEEVNLEEGGAKV